MKVITGISGSYYEGQACSSNIFFELSDGKGKNGKLVVQFEEPVAVHEENVRNIRKLMEMGSEELYLVARREKEGCWQIVGLNDNIRSLNGICFAVIRHMVWSMKMGKKESIHYNCGKYVIECSEFGRREFRRKIENLFAINGEKRVFEVFEAALSQKHGTIIIVMDEKIIEEEVKRLVKESAGNMFSPAEMKQQYIYNITAIDGAAMFDPNGKCYGNGIILDGNAQISGKPERGARYHSTLRYIKTCMESGKAALGVIVSEDKTVDIISTQDEIK